MDAYEYGKLTVIYILFFTKYYIKYNNKTMISFEIEEGIKENKIPELNKEIEIEIPRINGQVPEIKTVVGNEIETEEKEDKIIIRKTEAVRVINYVPNQINFIRYEKKDDTDTTPERNKNWTVTNVDQIMPTKSVSSSDGIEGDKDNFVNRLYLPELKTYKTLITTEIIKDNSTDRKLAPKEKGSVELILSTNTDSGVGNDGLIYNNMAEIIATANTNGRRCEFSIPGNEEMSDQTLGENAAKDAKSSVDRLLVEEIDADSAQKVILMPPTGTENAMNNSKSNIFSNILSLIMH